MKNKYNKRYWLFVMYPYDEEGGLNDVKAMSDDIAKLKRHGKKHYKDFDLVYIFDSKKRINIFNLNIDNNKWNEEDFNGFNDQIEII